MTQGFTTQILPFHLKKFQTLALKLKKGYKPKLAKDLRSMGVSEATLKTLNRRRPSHQTISDKLGSELVEATLEVEEDVHRWDWEWTSDELLYDQFLAYLEKRDRGAFEMANLLAPIYENRRFPPYRLPFRAGGYQGYLSREEARRLLVRLGRKPLADRFANMEAHLDQYPELIHRVEPYKRLRELLRKLVQSGHDALFWVDLEKGGPETSLSAKAARAKIKIPEKRLSREEIKPLFFHDANAKMDIAIAGDWKDVAFVIKKSHIPAIGEGYQLLEPTDYGYEFSFRWLEAFLEVQKANELLDPKVYANLRPRLRSGDFKRAYTYVHLDRGPFPKELLLKELEEKVYADDKTYNPQAFANEANRIIVEINSAPKSQSS